MPSIASPRSRSTHRRRDIQGARLGHFAMTLRRQGPGGHGGPGALRDKLRPIFVCGSENMDREAIADYGITVTRPPLRNRCPGARWGMTEKGTNWASVLDPTIALS